MNVDKAFAKFSILLKMLDGGDTSKRRVEHRSFLQLMFIHHQLSDTGQKDFS
jgi:hypothetical protein